MLSILLSVLVCAAASLFCACLMTVQIAVPYAVAGSTPGLYTCVFSRLVLKCGLAHLNANANARDESNANANASAQHLNQMQMQMRSS